MTSAQDPHDLLSELLDMRGYWVSAEIDIAYGLSLARSQSFPVPEKTKKRAGIVMSRNLARAADRTQELTKWLAEGFGPPGLIRELLARIANTERSYREMLAIIRATPVAANVPAPHKAITSVLDLPGWLALLQEWARPETEIIDDLNRTVAAGTGRPDEALDGVQWSAEDDIEAIDVVLRRAEGWKLDPSTLARLRRSSEEARAQLLDLIAVVQKARPFTIDMRIAHALAEAATASGRKPN